MPTGRFEIEIADRTTGESRWVSVIAESEREAIDNVISMGQLVGRSRLVEVLPEAPPRGLDRSTTQVDFFEAAQGPFALQLYRPESLASLYWWALLLFIVSVPLFLLYGTGLVTLVISIVLSSVLHYRMWRQIQDGHARTTPGIAVGLLFVPLFNLYWCFVSYWGLAKDLGNYMDRRRIFGARPSESIAVGLSVFTALCIIPYLGIATAGLAIITGYVFHYQCMRASQLVSRSASDQCYRCGTKLARLSPDARCSGCGAARPRLLN